VCGLDAHREGEAVKQQVGLVARRPGLLNSASLRRLKNMVRPFYREWQEQIFRHYMNQFELNENLLYGHLGPAAKKQFTLSLALAHKPKLLLLEEPFLQLPAEEKEPVARALRQEQQERGLSLLLATASPEEAATWADTLHIMHNGSLRLSLSAEQVPEYSAGLNWQGLRKHSQNGPTAQKIAQTQALFAYYTKTGEKNA
jgi:ABC-2 type transport system ATP-binding protein